MKEVWNLHSPCCLQIYNQCVTKTNCSQSGSFKITAFTPHTKTIGYTHTKQRLKDKQTNKQRQVHHQHKKENNEVLKVSWDLNLNLDPWDFGLLTLVIKKQMLGTKRKPWRD